MLNHIVLMGRLTRDVELRTTQSDVSVASFTLACDRDFGGRDGEKETDFIDCVARGLCRKILCKGPHGCRQRPPPDPSLDGSRREQTLQYGDCRGEYVLRRFQARQQEGRL